jgi:hypothetical protein
MSGGSSTELETPLYPDGEWKALHYWEIAGTRGRATTAALRSMEALLAGVVGLTLWGSRFFCR